MTSTDVPILKAMHAASGFEYAWPDGKKMLIEAAFVVVDDHDQPIMGVFAERSVQLSLICGDESPLVNYAGLRELHSTMRNALKAKGYKSADAWLPPEIEASFGRVLMKRFGWLKNMWASYSVKI